MSFNQDCDSEIQSVEKELSKVEGEIQRLRQRQEELRERRDALKDQKDLQKSKSLGKENWERSNFEWSDRLEVALKTIFNISDFRPQQLSAMNATLTGNHALVVMPTGAGKSLCYQLPAIVSEGITVVVSPLISLMEDQVMSLTKRNIPAKLMTSTSTKQETNAALDDMTNNQSLVKLLYVTPERFAKSKRFMAKLQKCFAEGRLQRIAIDEVHCCSQWGHDFRPDYKFLGVLSSMFPGIPILGLTATATSRVFMDVQKMLDIRGCLIIKSSFNRPNLFYHIIDKPSSTKECIDILEKLLKYRYKDQSGIIYATSIKDCEELTLGLRERGLKIACYHANLEADRRSTIHTKWAEKYYQAIVATVAFGLGIDKPDVRFVLHHSLSKAMESYYQESGRAGRDGERAECVMMYRMQDIFRLSTMVFSSSGSLEHLYGMVKYCLEPSICRRKIIASHFDEDFGSEDCQKMCDRCCQSNTIVKEMFVDDYCRDLYKIIRWASKQDSKLTAQKLIDSWFGKGATNLRVSVINPPSLSKTQAETIVTYLLIEGYLREDFHYTAYSTISYIKVGPNSSYLDDESYRIKLKTKSFGLLKTEEVAPTSFPRQNKNTSSQNLEENSHKSSSHSNSKDSGSKRNSKDSGSKRNSKDSGSKRKSSKVCSSDSSFEVTSKKVPKICDDVIIIN